MAQRNLIDKSRLQFNPDAQRLFSKRDWQRGFKSSLIVAGRDFIVLALPKRFTSFAVTRLGYRSKKMDKSAGASREQQIKRAIAIMRVNGDREKIVATACAQWGGWDPTGREHVSSIVWKRWYVDAARAGRIRPAKDQAGWAAARSLMRRDVLEQSRLRERIRNHAIDEYVDQGKQAEPIPLVETGWLEKTAMTKSRPDAKTRGGMAELTIRIPRENRVAPIVGHVLGQHTSEEADRVASIVETQMVAFIQGAKSTGTAKRPKLSPTARQQRTIGARIRGAMTASARSRVHKNRTTTPHKARS